MTTFSSQPEPRQIDKLRALHQTAAKLTAATGAVPKAFAGDPTFSELVTAHDKPVNSSA